MKDVRRKEYGIDIYDFPTQDAAAGQLSAMRRQSYAQDLASQEQNLRSGADILFEISSILYSSNWYTLLNFKNIIIFIVWFASLFLLVTSQTEAAGGGRPGVG